jgi:flagellar assembly protein FliH
MGLIKGNNLRYGTGEAIVGADVIPPPEAAEELRAVVPSTTPVLSEDDLAATLGDDLDDLFELPEEEPAEDASWQEPMQAFDKVREQVLHGAEEASDMEANGFGEQIQDAATNLMTEALAHGEAALLEANPEGDFAGVAPYVQRRVATDLDLELIGTVNEIRWTHLQRVEKQLVDGAEEIARGLLAEHPPDSFVELMGRREAILSEARLEAERQLLESMTRSAETMAQAEQARAATMLELEGEKERILAALREQAFNEGYEEGKAAGEAMAAQYISDALMKFNEMAMAFPAAVKKNEEKLVTLALEIARKVIQDEIELQPEIVQRTVETALKRVSDLEQVVVKVNPLDLDLILPKQDLFKALVPDVQAFSIEGSHTIQRGGAIIETNSGSINATIQAQLGIVEEVFKKVRAEYEDEMLGDLS